MTSFPLFTKVLRTPVLTSLVYLVISDILDRVVFACLKTALIAKVPILVWKR